MGWILKGTPKTFKVTAKLANEFATMDSAHTDRPLSERRLGVYRSVLKAAGFRPVTWAKAWCKETEQFYRVNGKHTSTLFASVDLRESPQDVFVVVEEYECDTLEDVARLYATFDSQTQVRNQTDINRSFAATIPELKEFDTRIINLLVGGLVYADFPTATGGSTDVSGFPKTPAERAEYLFDNVEFCVWAKDILLERGKCPHLHRVPVVGAMVGCWRKAKKDAETFWTAVREETGEKPDLPDRKLAKFLSTMASNNGTHAGVPRRFRITAKEFFCKSIKAWNAWRKKESTDLKYFADAKLPSIV